MPPPPRGSPLLAPSRALLLLAFATAPVPGTSIPIAGGYDVNAIVQKAAKAYIVDNIEHVCDQDVSAGMRTTLMAFRLVSGSAGSIIDFYNDVLETGCTIINSTGGPHAIAASLRIFYTIASNVLSDDPDPLDKLAGDVTRDVAKILADEGFRGRIGEQVRSMCREEEKGYMALVKERIVHAFTVDGGDNWSEAANERLIHTACSFLGGRGDVDLPEIKRRLEFLNLVLRAIGDSVRYGMAR